MLLEIYESMCRQCFHLLCYKDFDEMVSVLAKRQLKLRLRNQNSERVPEGEKLVIA